MQAQNNQYDNPRLQAALAYAALGWHVLPCWWINDDLSCACGRECSSPGKHPIGVVAPLGQHSATTDSETIIRWWTMYPLANVAVELARSGLCAVDIDPRNGGLYTIDMIEAQHGPLKSDVLQFTGGGGEHRVFLRPVDGRLPGRLGPGVDLKVNGYIMVEPSRHKSGRHYAWEASGDPRDGITPPPLPDWLRDLASQQHVSVAADRQQRVLFVTEEQKQEIVAALRTIPADDRDVWLRVGMALQSTADQQWAFDVWTEWSQTSRKYDPVDQIRVWRSFRARGLDGITYRSIFELAKQHGGIVIPNQMVIDAAPPMGAPTLAWQQDTDNTPVLHESMPELPEHLLLPPEGALRDCVQWINDTAPKPQPVFAVQAAIAFAATVLGRRFRTDYDNYPSLYLLNIGESGCGKEYARSAIEALLSACGLAHLIGPSGYTSDSGVLSALLAQPNHCTVLDEMHRVLELASVKNNIHLRSMLTFLVSAWGQLHGVVRPRAYSTFGLSKRDRETLAERTIYKPAITLLGLAVPEFWERVGTAAARDGFLNRFLIVETDIGRQVSSFKPHQPVPDSIIEWAQRIRARYDGTVDPDMAPNMDIEPVTVPIDAEARRMFAELEADCMTGDLCAKAREAGAIEIVNRSTEQAMRLSLIVALSADAHEVQAQHAHWAIQWVRAHTLRTIHRLKYTVANSDFAATCKQVYGVLARKGKPMNMARIVDYAPRMQDYNVQQRAQVMAALMQEGKVREVESPKTVRSGRAGQWFVAIKRGGDED